MNPYLERMNYENDPRVIAGRRESRFKSIDEKRMVATVSLDFLNDEGEEVTETLELPFTYEVCGTCDGKGSHVNPSIDCGGLTREDFYDDPDFAEDYQAGVYDESCYECRGKRVVPEINEGMLNAEQKSFLERVREFERDEAEFEAIARAERSMGA